MFLNLYWTNFSTAINFENYKINLKTNLRNLICWYMFINFYWTNFSITIHFENYEINLRNLMICWYMFPNFYWTNFSVSINLYNYEIKLKINLRNLLLRQGTGSHTCASTRSTRWSATVSTASRCAYARWRSPTTWCVETNFYSNIKQNLEITYNLVRRT